MSDEDRQDPPVDSLGAYAAPLASIDPQPPRTQTVALRAVFGGGTSAVFTGVAAGIPYWLANRHDGRIDWGQQAPVYLLFCAGMGALLGLGIALGILGADRFLVRFGASLERTSLGAVSGAGVGGLVAGVLPGAVGSTYFGSQNAPFMGTAAIAALPFVGVLLASTAIADIDARAAGFRARPALGFALALLASVPFALLCGVLVATVDDETALDMFRSGAGFSRAGFDDSPWLGLARIGGFYGALLGAALGLHAGITTALARRVFRTRVAEAP